MSNPEELSISELRRRRQQGSETAGAAPRPPGAGQLAIEVSGAAQPKTADSELASAGRTGGRFISALRRNWTVSALAGLSIGLMGGVIGFLASRYSASLTLVQRDPAAVVDRGADAEVLMPRQFSSATMVQLMVSPELARRVAALAMPVVSEARLRASVEVHAAADRELVTLSLVGSRPQELVNLLNLYASQAVALTREIQLEDFVRLNEFLKRKVQEADAELEKVRSQSGALQADERIADPEAQTKALIGQLGEVMTRLESAHMEAELLELQSADAQLGDRTRQTGIVLERLTQAREKLSVKLARLTEAHPEVITLKGEIAELERQLAGDPKALPGGVASLANLQLVELKARKSALADEVKKQEELRAALQKRIVGLSEKGLQYQLLKAKQDSLFHNRQLLADRQRRTQLYQENASGYYRVLAEATLADVSSRGRYLATVLGLCAGLLAGFVGGAAGVCLVEARDDRIRTAEDVRRITGLPLLASAGDLNKMTDDEKDRWAFRTWTLINGKLNRDPDRGLVCGFISARQGEGKSTWIDLLAGAARRRGLRVLKITARASAPDAAVNAQTNQAPGRSGSATGEPIQSPNQPASDVKSPKPAAAAISNALIRPIDVALQLADPKAGTVDVCLPDWVWNLDHRHQWQTALDRWKGVENVVILVELPAAGEPESTLLAENVPQLIWLTGSGMARTRETRMCLETLKHARCQIVGAVLNKDPGSLQNV